ncbi:serine hydrolase domain-containing protein [Pseudactinotalea sp. Z1732]|uniref:serine hydrolase domain-containing protein n=1 Tax=Pseudactinotalea sp. Z1732 TaxID=3413026 RepID=UPI003C7ECACD
MDGLEATLQRALDSATLAARVPVTPPGRHGEPGAEPRRGTPAAHAVIAHRGHVVATAHAGAAELFTPDGGLLADPRPLGPGDVFDLASLTKVLVAATALTQVRSGVIGLEDPVVRHLPAFTGDGREDVLVRHLLLHTSGLPAMFEHWDTPAHRGERVAVVLSQRLRHRAGRVHTYSCVGYQVLGLLLEQATGRPLPELLAREVTGPLGMADTGYHPAEPDRVVPTEYQHDPARGLVRGQVHDEAAWVLGGAGNAGVFATAADVLTFAEAIRTATGPIDDAVRNLLSTDLLDARGRVAAGFGQAVGLRVGDASFMGVDADGLLGHTGFTGTSLVIDPARELSVVLLTNRVHPYRSAFTVMGLRRAVVELAQAWVDRA